MDLSDQMTGVIAPMDELGGSNVPEELIKTLSGQHYELLCLGFGLSVAADPDTRWRKLKEYETLLMNHLALEDRELYTSALPDFLYCEHLREMKHAAEFFSWWSTPEAAWTHEFELGFELFEESIKERMKYETQVVFEAFASVEAT